MSVLSELKVVCDKVLAGETEDEEGTAEVLTELLLTLVSKPSTLLRKLAQQVFGAFSRAWTEKSLQLLYYVGAVVCTDAFSVTFNSLDRRY